MLKNQITRKFFLAAIAGAVIISPSSLVLANSELSKSSLLVNSTLKSLVDENEPNPTGTPAPTSPSCPAGSTPVLVSCTLSCVQGGAVLTECYDCRDKNGKSVGFQTCTAPHSLNPPNFPWPPGTGSGPTSCSDDPTNRQRLCALPKLKACGKTNIGTNPPWVLDCKTNPAPAPGQRPAPNQKPARGSSSIKFFLISKIY